MKTKNFSIIRSFFTALILILSFTSLIKSQGKMMKPSDGSTIKVSKYDFNDTVDMLKGAIEEQNLMVIHIVDAQKMLRMAGKKVKGMKQIFYFHPKFMKRVMEANKSATIQIPLKFIVMEKPDGKVVIRYFSPSKVLGSYKGEEKIAKELDGLVDKIINVISK